MSSKRQSTPSVRSRSAAPGTLRPLAAALLAITSLGAHAANDTWIGASGGYWDVGGNWNTGSTPTTDDNIATGSANTIFRTGTLSITQLSGTGNLNMQGGTLKINGFTSSIGSLTMSGAASTLAVNPTSTLTAGSLNFGNGTIGAAFNEGVVNVTGLTTFDPAGAITIYSTLNLNGGATWAAASGGAISLIGGNTSVVGLLQTGQMRIAAGTTFSDLGNLAAGQSRSLGVNTLGQVANYGTYTRSGLGTTNVQSSFYNAGTVNIDGGAMNFSSAFGVSGAGTWNIASGAAMQVAGVTSTLSGTLNNAGSLTTSANTSLNLVGYSGNGSIAVTGGTLTTAAGSATMAPTSLSIATGTAQIGNTINAGALNLSSAGTLSGTGVVNAGTLTFGQGTMTGAGTTTVSGVATIDGTQAQSVITGRTLNLNGATTWTASTSGSLNTGSTGHVVVGSGATFADQGTTGAGQTRQLGGSGSAGTFVNQGTYNRSGLGTTRVNAGFSNDGVLNLTGGAINVAAGTTSAGRWNIGAGTTLNFSGGASDLHGGPLNNNGGTISVTGGTLTASGGGTSTGTISVATGRTLTFGGSTYAVNGGAFTSDGTVAIASGGALAFGGGTHAINSGTLSNAGTLTVSAGTLNVASGVNFNGAGTVSVAGGTLNTSAYANLAGGTMNVSGGTMNFMNGGTLGSLSISGGNVAYQYVGSASPITVGTLSFTGGSIVDPQAIGLATVVSGTSTFGSGTETLGGGHQLTLNGNGTWLAGNGSTLNIVGGSGVQAQINIGSGTTFADLGGGNRNLGNNLFSIVNNGGSYTRTGSGTTTVAGTFNNIGTLDISGGTMAFGAGLNGVHTSSGAIRIAAGSTMQVDGNGFTVGAGTVSNQGLLAINGATTTLASGVSYGGSGAITVTGGLLDSRIASGITTGAITLGGGAASFAGAVNASSLSLAGGTLTAAGNVTVSTDYGNTGFGTGNAFNKRANVGGAGSIDGSNVAEAITGANVTNGTTGDATLTIGNVRVGVANSYAYRVANTGTGATLRGAIQTTGSGIGVSDARLSGSGVTAANFGPLAAGANSGDLAVRFTASSAGALVLNGVNTIHVANNFGNVAEQNLSIVAGAGAGVYDVASGSASVSLGNVRVGNALTHGITVSNTAATGAYSEDLNASIVATSGGAVAGGSLVGLVAGASNGSALVASLDSASAGAKSGSVTIDFATAGKVAGISNGLGTLAVGSQIVALSGGVYNAAVGSVATTPITLANQRVGGNGASALTISNTAAPGAFSEALNAGIAGVTGGATAGGHLTNLAAGASDGGTVSVGVNTTSAGLKSGTVTIGYQTDGTGSNGHSGLAAIDAGAQTVTVSGAVYRLANASTSIGPVTAVGRVGGPAATTVLGITNGSPDAYTEGLNVTRGATAAGFTSSGGIVNLAAGASSNAIGVTLDTSVAGLFGGSQVLQYVSTGAGTTGAADVSVGSATVTLNGKVYAAAVAGVSTPTIDFGIVHVGDTVGRGVSVTNTATGALTDVLTGAAFGAGGPFSASGTLGAGLAAGQTSSALTVGLHTATAGVYAGTATFDVASHDADQADAALARLAIGLTGTVNEYASDAFAFGSGAGSLTRSGSTFFLDFGTVMQGSGVRSATLFAGNVASGPADLLDGAFQFLDAADFGEGALAGFAGLAAGQSGGPLMFTFDALAAGDFMDTIVLHGIGHNAGGYSAAIGDLQLVVRGAVVGAAIDPTAVPEPDAWMLVGLGLPLLLLRRRVRTMPKR